jgi:hypothetical protein
MISPVLTQIRIIGSGKQTLLSACGWMCLTAMVNSLNKFMN